MDLRDVPKRLGLGTMTFSMLVSYTAFTVVKYMSYELSLLETAYQLMASVALLWLVLVTLRLAMRTVYKIALRGVL